MIPAVPVARVPDLFFFYALFSMFRQDILVTIGRLRFSIPENIRRRIGIHTTQDFVWLH